MRAFANWPIGALLASGAATFVEARNRIIMASKVSEGVLRAEVEA